MSTRILIAEDQKILREGLRSLLQGESDMQVVGEADNGREAVRLARDLEPDVVIMDIGMPDLNGIDATRQILSQAPAARVLALSMHSDRRFVDQMLEAGATGYLLKDCAFEELRAAVRRVVRRETYLGAGVTDVVVSGYVDGIANDTHPRALSPREREVAQLIAEGHAARDIADALCVSVKTIETHRRSIMDKLGLTSVAQLTKWAVREGLTQLED